MGEMERSLLAAEYNGRQNGILNGGKKAIFCAQKVIEME
jgi:hypothetical protein